MIFFYFDIEGRKPAYDLPFLEGISDKKYPFRGKHDTVINMHIQEIAENAADYAHFIYVHDKMRIPWTNIVIPGVELKFSTLYNCVYQ
jgi:hypothetical protein